MRDNLYSDFNSQVSAHCSLPIISTNGYYGYQPVRTQQDTNKSDDYQNQMEVDSNSCSENVNITDNNNHQFNRKRQNAEPIEMPTFKKRRQNGNFQPADYPKPKFGRKPTHNLPDIPRSVFSHF